MNVLDNSTRARSLGSTTAFATGGTALGGAVATLIYELFLPSLTANGALALGVVCSTLLAAIGGWLAPSKKAETEAYLGSVLAMAQYGDHGRLQPASSVSTEPASTEAVSEPEDGYELIGVGGTEFTDPAYASTK